MKKQKCKTSPWKCLVVHCIGSFEEFRCRMLQRVIVIDEISPESSDREVKCAHKIQEKIHPGNGNGKPWNTNLFNFAFFLLCFRLFWGLLGGRGFQ
eukprot:4999610-Amphidinium_carterae.1